MLYNTLFISSPTTSPSPDLSTDVESSVEASNPFKVSGTGLGFLDSSLSLYAGGGIKSVKSQYVSTTYGTTESNIYNYSPVGVVDSTSDSASSGSVTNDTNNGNTATSSATAYSGYTTTYTPAVSATASITGAYSSYEYTIPVRESIDLVTEPKSYKFATGTWCYLYLDGYGFWSESVGFRDLSEVQIGSITSGQSIDGKVTQGYCFLSEEAAIAFAETLMAYVNADKGSNTTPEEGNYWTNEKISREFYYISGYTVSDLYTTSGSWKSGLFFNQTSYEFSNGEIISGATGEFGSTTTIAGGSKYYTAKYYKADATTTTEDTSYKFSNSTAATNYAYYLSYKEGWTTDKGSYGSYTNGDAYKAASVSGSFGSSTTVAGGDTYYTANYYNSSGTLSANTTKFTTSAGALQYAYKLSYDAGWTYQRGSTSSTKNGNAANTFFSSFQHGPDFLKN